jgi:hypothetical protein
MALRTAVSDTRWAANAVLLREPLKPAVPPLLQEITLPSGSVSVTMVLLNVELMKAFPLGTNFRSRLLVRVLDRAIKLLNRRYFLVIVRRLPATVRRPPRLVRALVLVRWPRSGRPRRCRSPR